MAPPRNAAGRQPGRHPVNRPAEESTAVATAKSQTPMPSLATIGRAGGKRQQAPLAAASVFAPVGRRKSWWYTYRCRVCGAYLFGRAKSLDAVAGQRRAGCGHKVIVMAARIYTQPEPGAAA